jgi:two-component system, cell cycle response regulator DivK
MANCDSLQGCKLRNSKAHQGFRMSKTLLHIEDDDLVRMLIKMVVEEMDCRYLGASSAAEGISLARRERPDLILMDVLLPEMDGLTATRMIRSDSQLREIPILAFSARAMKGDMEKGLEAGCDGYISKAIDIKGFADAIDRLLSR